MPKIRKFKKFTFPKQSIQLVFPIEKLRYDNCNNTFFQTNSIVQSNRQFVSNELFLSPEKSILKNNFPNHVQKKKFYNLPPDCFDYPNFRDFDWIFRLKKKKFY